MRFEIDRARGLYQRALPGIRYLSREGRLAVGAAAMLYQAILNEIEAIQYQVYRLRAHTSGLKKIAMLPRIAYTIFML
jgi:phytoene synthase